MGANVHSLLMHCFCISESWKDGCDVVEPIEAFLLCSCIGSLVPAPEGVATQLVKPMKNRAECS